MKLPIHPVDPFAVIVSAPGEGQGCDFVSRFFAPAGGIPEDPATGAAHCTLVPYRSRRLGKTRLHARQLSQRGEIEIQPDGGSRPGVNHFTATRRRQR